VADADVAALLGAADQLLDRRVGKVEQRKGHIPSFRRPSYVPFRGRLDIACHKSLPDRRAEPARQVMVRPRSQYPEEGRLHVERPSRWCPGSTTPRSAPHAVICIVFL
jgi:hypothetical protein